MTSAGFSNSKSPPHVTLRPRHSSVLKVHQQQAGLSWFPHSYGCLRRKLMVVWFLARWEYQYQFIIERIVKGLFSHREQQHRRLLHHHKKCCNFMQIYKNAYLLLEKDGVGSDLPVAEGTTTDFSNRSASFFTRPQPDLRHTSGSL